MPLPFRSLLDALSPAHEPDGPTPVFRRPAPLPPRRQTIGFTPIGLAMRSALARDPGSLPVDVPRSARDDRAQGLHHSVR